MCKKTIFSQQRLLIGSVCKPGTLRNSEYYFFQKTQRPRHTQIRRRDVAEKMLLFNFATLREKIKPLNTFTILLLSLVWAMFLFAVFLHPHEQA